MFNSLNCCIKCALLKPLQMIFISELSEIVDSIMFLLSDKASMIHGITLPVEGGLLTS